MYVVKTHKPVPTAKNLKAFWSIT